MGDKGCFKGTLGTGGLGGLSGQWHGDPVEGEGAAGSEDPPSAPLTGIPEASKLLPTP